MSLSKLNIKNRMAEIAKRQKLAQEEVEKKLRVTVSSAAPTADEVEQAAEDLEIHFDKHDAVPLGKSEITEAMLNEKQLQAIEYAIEGKSFCLIGSAGTGKTTTQRLTVARLESSDRIRPIMGMQYESQVYHSVGMLSIGIFSFTNKAVNNIREALPEQFKPMCTTLHSVLEYHPVFEEYEDFDAQGKPMGIKTSMEFIPRFGKTVGGKGDGFSLPHLDVVILEEAGSVPTDLWDNFIAALPNPDETLFIFLGDLNQLPPVFGDAVLGFKLLDLPIVELTEPYRAALLSPITSLADTIKNGVVLSDEQLAAFMEMNDKGYGNISINPFTAKARGLTKEKMCRSFGSHLYQWVMDGRFKQDESVVLCPFNKTFGTIELNKWIGEAYRKMGNLTTYHVIAGEQSHYYCEGDRVMYNKVECYITGFEFNKKYMGIMPLNPSNQLDRWGTNEGNEALTRTALSLDDMLDKTGEQMGDAGKVRQASHLIKLTSICGRFKFTAASAGEVNSIMFTWALSIHKSQGSEWPHVIVVLHESHKILWKRELIYTAITRARSQLDIYYTGQKHKLSRDSAFQIGVTRSEYNAVTLEGKLNYFREQRRKMELKRKVAASGEDFSKYSRGL